MENRLLTLIFSKDRALQLDATLRSLAACATDDGRRVVLYLASNDGHSADYLALPSEHPAVEFRAQGDFQRDVQLLLKEADWVLFSVDDSVFVRPFSVAGMVHLLRADSSRIGVSLRLGSNTLWCFTANQPQRAPAFQPLVDGWFEFAWKDQDWEFGYPLEVSSSLFSTRLIEEALQEASYANPNELEAALQRAAPRLADRFGHLVCPEISRAFSIPLNKVQSTFDNRAGHRFGGRIETLQQWYRLGFRIEIERLRGHVPRACHELLELPLRRPVLPRDTIEASLAIAVTEQDAVSWRGNIPVTTLADEDLARILEVATALREADHQANEPVLVQVLRKILGARETVAEQIAVEQEQSRKRQQQLTDTNLTWMAQQIEAKDKAIQAGLEAYEKLRAIIREMEEARAANVARSAAELATLKAGKEACDREIRRLGQESEIQRMRIEELLQEQEASFVRVRELQQMISAQDLELQHRAAQLREQAGQIATLDEGLCELRRALDKAERLTEESRGWARELEAARDWHEAQRNIAERSLRGWEEKRLLRIAVERLSLRLTRFRCWAGDRLQKRLKLDRPPQVVAAIRGLPRRIKPHAAPAKRVREASSDQRPCVLLCLPFLVLGGAERVLSQIVEVLNANGFSVIVITSVQADPSQGSAEEWFRPHVRQIVDVSRDATAVARKRLLELVDLANPRIIWIAGSELAYELLPQIRESRKGIAVVDLLFNEVGHTANNRRWNSLIDVHVAESRQVAAWLEARGESPERIRVIPNGVDFRRFGGAVAQTRSRIPTTIKVGYLGRLSSEKGPDLFLQIAAQLRSRDDLDFVIAGIGPMQPLLRDMSRELGLESKVQFLGVQDARTFLTTCDVLVIPSRVDGRPNAALEAMAMGVPIVAARVGGLPELVAHEETGWLCAPGDIVEFAARIDALTRDPPLLRAAGLAARLKAERELDHRQMGNCYVELFRTLSS